MSLLCSVVFVIFVFCYAYCMPSQPPVNEDYIGTIISCTPEEKLCFKYERVLNEYDGKCYPIKKQGPCPESCLFFLDKDAVLEYGIFVGKCVFDNKWPKPWFEEENGEHVLVSDECKSIERNIFGEYICFRDFPSWNEVQIQQPEEEGLCRIPNFMNGPRIYPIMYYDTRSITYRGPCLINEHKCLVENKIYWPQDGQCYDPLSTEPCAEGEWLLFDEREFLSGRKFFVCRPIPCERNEVLMDFDGKCYPKDEVLTALCPNTSDVVTNIRGRSGCEAGVEYENSYVVVSTIDPASGKCSLTQYRSEFFLAILGSKECSYSNLYNCPKKVKFLSPPGPI